MRRIFKLAFIMIVVFALGSAVLAADKTSKPGWPKQSSKKSIETEIKLGDEAAQSAEKTIKLIKDEKLNARVQAIGQAIADVAKVSFVMSTYGNPDLADFPYAFKIVDDKEVNAFSLPGGRVYVNKGLLDRVESDDELAGVIAHEVAHIAHHHMVQLLKKQGQYDAMVFAMIAAAVIAKTETTDVQNVFYGAKLFEIAKLNSYSQVAEDDADRTAVEYLVKTKYNPVGMFTFMEKLARDQQFDPIDPGIFQNHPMSRDRVEKIAAQLKKHDIPINRRSVTTASTAIVREVKVRDKSVSEVVIGNKSIFQPADVAGVVSAERAKGMAEVLNKILDQNPEVRDLKVGGDGTEVYIKQELVVAVKQQDADLAGMTREALAEKVKTALQGILVTEGLDRMY